MLLPSSPLSLCLAPYVVSEANELVEAIGLLDEDDEATDEEFIDELGDVLLQVVLHAAIAEQEGRFTLADVAEAVNAKMIRRHPHVFADAIVATVEDMHLQWADIKAQERADKAARKAAKQ